MSLFTPTSVRELEQHIVSIIVDDYARLSQDTWWQLVAKVRQTKTKKELIAWLIQTAVISDVGQGGNLSYADQAAVMTEMETRHAGAGLKLLRAQLEDVYNGEPGGEGVEAADNWARGIAAYMAYWPQKKTAEFLKLAHLSASSGGFTSYDNVPFFSTSHLVNPKDAGMGTFSNLFTSVPLDTGVTMDVAANNLATVWANIKSIKMPNGENDPRKLKPKGILVPPKMFPRVKQLVSADYIAQAAASGGGSADFRAYISSLGFAQPICADELSGFEGDTTYFVVAEQAANDALGGVVYLEREAFRMTQYGEMNSAELGRMKALEWQVNGRNAIAPGHPFLLFKCKAA